MRIGSLFSGFEGLGMAVQQVVGGDIAWVSDIDPGACKTLAHRYPDVPNLGDITAVDWSAVEPVDVLTGGFPCQDVSAAGKRLGMRPGTRSGLWSHMAYAIDRLRPPLVVIENVRGLLSARAHGELEPCPWCVGDDEGVPLRALGGVLGDLAGLGYDAAWHGLRASDVGAPHARFRVFVVAWPAQDADLSARGQRWVAAPGQAEGGRPWAHTGRRGGAPAADAGRDAWTEDDAHWAATPGSCGGATAVTHAGSLGWVGGPGVCGDGWSTNLGGEAGGHAGDSPVAWGGYEPAIRRWERLTRPAPPPTEPGRNGARLSPRFVEWMQDLPDWWVTGVPGLSRNEQLKLLGNGVVRMQAAEALRRLLLHVPAGVVRALIQGVAA